MSFAAPFWLYFTPFLLLACGAILVYGLRRRETLLGRFAADRLIDSLTKKASTQRTRLKAACFMLAVASIGIALARPQLGVEWSERKSRGLDIVFVLDSSKSMLATDIRPTRLDRAKLAIIDLVERLESDRIGLIAFAGQAFLQTPPTLDYSAFRESLEAVDPSILTSGGSDLGQALRETIEAFPTETNVKVAVLLTDGEDLGGDALAASEAAKASGIQVFTVGIGTPEGDYLRITQSDGSGEFIRDSDGQPVRSQLDEATLQEIARLTNGGYSRLSSESLNRLFEDVIATLPRSERTSEMKEIPIERFQWALAAALILLLLESFIRRRARSSLQAVSLIALLFVTTPGESTAQDISGNDPRVLYNHAHESLLSEAYEAAIQAYESAIAASEDLELQRDALYNIGHAQHQKGRQLYLSGDPQGALESITAAEQSFASALEMGPEDSAIAEDLKKIADVRKAIEDFLEQQAQQQQQQEEEEPQDSSEESEDSQSPEDEQDSGASSGESGDPSQQENQESEKNDTNENSDASQSSENGNSQQAPDDREASGDGDPSSQPSEAQDRESSADKESAPEESDEMSDENSSPESTRNPLEDVPQSLAESDPSTPESDGETSGVPEGEASNPEDGAAAATVQQRATEFEGMTEAEAAALLDSLQNKENLLPFIDARPTRGQRQIRDW